MSGQLPDSLQALADICIECGDSVDERWLDNEGRCVGCRERGER